jgi:recombination protein RecR
MISRRPAALENLLQELTRLPGIGRRGAERMALHLLAAAPDQAEALARAIGQLRQEVRACAICGNWAQDERCAICADPRRQNGQLCVVERPADLWAVEQAETYAGRYPWRNALALGGRDGPRSAHRGAGTADG